jgi:hypothetical protein
LQLRDPISLLRNGSRQLRDLIRLLRNGSRQLLDLIRLLRNQSGKLVTGRTRIDGHLSKSGKPQR